MITHEGWTWRCVPGRRVPEQPRHQRHLAHDIQRVGQVLGQRDSSVVGTQRGARPFGCSAGVTVRSEQADVALSRARRHMCQRSGGPGTAEFCLVKGPRNRAARTQRGGEKRAEQLAGSKRNPETDHGPKQGKHDRLPPHEPQHIDRLRAERPPHADLLRPPSNTVGDGAEEADGRQSGRQAGQQRRHRHVEAQRSHDVVDKVPQRRDGLDNEVGVSLLHLGPERRGESRRIALRADHQVVQAHRHLGERHVEVESSALQFPVSRILDHTDDRLPRRCVV